MGGSQSLLASNNNNSSLKIIRNCQLLENYEKWFKWLYILLIPDQVENF